MIKIVPLLWVVFTFLCVTPQSGCCGDEISWIYLGLPPIYIEEGPLANKGFGDFFLQLLIKNLGGYDHKLLKCNIARAQMMLKNQEKVGHPAILKRPDRESYVAFSIPAYVSIPSGALVPKIHLNKFKPFLTNKGIFSLERAIAQSDLKAGHFHRKSLRWGHR